MNSLRDHLLRSPILARVAPFVLFIFLTFAQGWLPGPARFWLYLAKTILGAWMLWIVRPAVSEMRWKLSLPAVLAGVGVFVIWVGLDPMLIGLGVRDSYPKVTLTGPAWNPLEQWGSSSAIAWFFVAVRLLGSSLVVPPLEEVFFRSFFYRYLVRVDFQTVPLGAFLWMPFLVTPILFGLEHREWLAGVLCGLVYQGLVCWKKRLGDAITAHAITNALLGLYVVTRGQWVFW